MTTIREHVGLPEPEQEDVPEREPGDEPGQERTAPAPAAPKKAKHRATYARDNKKGGYMIRVAGPTPEAYAGRDVPVHTKNGGVHTETLDKLIWVGTDRESGGRVALYTFVAKPRELEQLEF